MPEIKPTVYLDIHGVLADFVGGVGDLFNIKDLTNLWAENIGPHCIMSDALNTILDRPYEKRLSKKDIYKEINKIGSKFWHNLKAYPWSRDLYNYLDKRFDIILLTSPSLNPSSAKGIMKWMYTHIENDLRKFMICPSEHKHKLSRSGCVLIDDYTTSVDAFNKEAGKGILFPMPWNTRGIAGGFDEVVKVLHKVERYVESLNQDDKESPVIFT